MIEGMTLVETMVAELSMGGKTCNDGNAVMVLSEFISFLKLSIVHGVLNIFVAPQMFVFGFCCDFLIKCTRNST